MELHVCSPEFRMTIPLSSCFQILLNFQHRRDYQQKFVKQNLSCWKSEKQIIYKSKSGIERAHCIIFILSQTQDQPT
jgi:hypothetical protein